MTDSTTVVYVFLFALMTALATGLGALPLLFFKKVRRRWLGIGNAVAAGLMLTVSFNLIQEGVVYGMPRTVVGIIVGLVLIYVGHERLSKREETLQVGRLRGAGAMQAILIVGVMTAHSFAEGVGVGVSFGEGKTFGVFISLAIAVHNIPEGLAISLILVPDGVSVGRAAFWSVVSSLPQPLMAVPAFLVVEVFRPFLPFGLGLAGGAMIWMVISEIIPGALEEVSSTEVAVTATLAVAVMVAIQVLLQA